MLVCLLEVFEINFWEFTRSNELFFPYIMVCRKLVANISYVAYISTSDKQLKLPTVLVSFSIIMNLITPYSFSNIYEYFTSEKLWTLFIFSFKYRVYMIVII